MPHSGINSSSHFCPSSQVNRVVGRVDVEVNSLQQADVGFDNLLLGSEESSVRSAAVANFANAKGRCPNKDWNIFISDASETLQGIVDGNCSFENAEYRCKITANVDANSWVVLHSKESQGF